MASVPAAFRRRRRFSSTFSLVSPHLSPRLRLSKGGGLTPPSLVENPWQKLSGMIGETIAVTMLIGNAPKIGGSIFSPGFTLASVIANEFNEANQELHPEALIALGLVLLIISVLVNAAAIVIRQQFARGVGRVA